MSSNAPLGTSTRTGDDHVHEVASRLHGAISDGRPCPPIRDLLPSQDIETGYKVQELLTAAAIRKGRRVVGRKVGLTSPAVQQQLGVDQPDFGMLFDDMARDQSSPIAPGVLLQPKIEAEIAFVLSHDLDQPDMDVAAVKRAVDHVVPALEIVDSRIKDWDISIVDTVADNASSALFVLGDQYSSLGNLDLSSVTMTLTADGEQVSDGNGAACLGDPLNAVLWLAKTTRDFGRPLRAGEIVLSGALGPMVPIGAGLQYKAAISGLGTVSALIGEGAAS